MKQITLLFSLAFMSGCSDIYADLEVAFEVKGQPAESKQLETKTFSVSSLNRKGIATYGDIATILISSNGIYLDTGIPLMKSVLLPTNEVAGCSMTCFGTDDQHVDLLIPKTGTDLMIQRSKVLLDWCWENKKPMFSGKSKREWRYNKVSLPPASEFMEQLSDRKKYDEQRKQSCLGY